MLDVGALVKKSMESDQVFRIIETEDNTRALITATGEAAEALGSYPYWWPLRFLVPVDDTAPGR